MTEVDTDRLRPPIDTDRLQLDAQWAANAQFEAWRVAARRFVRTGGKPYDPWDTALELAIDHGEVGKFVAFVDSLNRKDA